MIMPMGDRAKLDDIVALARNAQASSQPFVTVAPALLRAICLELLERRAADMRAACDGAELALAGGRSIDHSDPVAVVEGAVEIQRQAREIVENLFDDLKRR